MKFLYFKLLVIHWFYYCDFLHMRNYKINQSYYPVERFNRALRISKIPNNLLPLSSLRGGTGDILAEWYTYLIVEWPGAEYNFFKYNFSREIKYRSQKPSKQFLFAILNFFLSHFELYYRIWRTCRRIAMLNCSEWFQELTNKWAENTKNGRSLIFRRGGHPLYCSALWGEIPKSWPQIINYRHRKPQ